MPSFLLPLSTHAEAPVEHEVLPVLHGLLGVHDKSAVQALQEPDLQTRLVPHGVPSVTDAEVSWQTGAPLLQESFPVWQAFVGVQLAPSVQDTQLAALLQTKLVPQLLPAALFPLSTHTELPVLHEVVPVLQALVGWQVTPAVHETQLPVLQTRLVPQLAPSAREVVVALHTGVPDEHDNVPVLHGLAVGVQVLPSAHATQAPAEHTLPVAQGVPFGALPETSHVEVPVEHEVEPSLHGSLGWHEVPALHVTQAPALHTLLVPQLVPFATAVVLAVHPIAGVHVVFPVTQGFSGTQSRPAEHETHTPPLQIWFVPQDVPLSTFALSMHTATPVLQAVMPLRHGLPLIAQVAPTLQATQVPVALHT
ncbi:MAG: hypothetical protein QM756_03495 [Polyangiaceae bacterium]